MRRLRLRADLSQEELADLMGTDLTQIGGIERGTRNPSYATLLRLATALNIRVREIATLADQLADESTTAPELDP